MAIWPNPESVIYPRAYPPKYPCRMTTRTVARAYPIHWHGAYMDSNGNGATDSDVGHSHVIRMGKVLPDPVDGHTHAITTLPCGVG
ncbi:MAG TPA: hypothetical protein VGY48_15635 [Vicinamibacterales bacterium]|jgi:hypothetical protein|nr:hypothetical protein [Vicinamibacterales bacterium]